MANRWQQMGGNQNTIRSTSDGGARTKRGVSFATAVTAVALLTVTGSSLLGCRGSRARKDETPFLEPLPLATQTFDLGDGVLLEMVWVPPGTFMMGSPDDEKGRWLAETQHRVTLTKGFWMGKYEVTQAQWQAVMGSNPSYFKGSDRPVDRVYWKDCQEFINRVNTRRQGTFRLPTEAEWEYACRAGSKTRFCCGDSARDLHDYAWYGYFASRKTHPVGRKRPNAWGLYDMHGNAWEWCQDWYGPYPSGPVVDPVGPSTSWARVARGEGWYTTARQCRSADRGQGEPEFRRETLGFRLVREAD